MKVFRTICLALCLCSALWTTAMPVLAEGENRIENDFLNDYLYYLDHPEEYADGNWRYCYGTVEEYFDMSYFAPAKSWVGSEAYCEISNGILSPGTNEMVVIVWEAPHSGSVSFTAACRKLYHVEGDGASMLIYNHAGDLLDEERMDLNDAEKKSYSDAYSIRKGERIFFVLDYVGNNWFDSTVFEIQIVLDQIDLADEAKAQSGCSGTLSGTFRIAFVLLLISTRLLRRDHEQE